uniref:Armadillo repeat-containing domain-containing protein n=1 Tax=Hemiselmis tepida TaxID=464990 RepID=A0A7S0W201_9CRYP
MADGKGGSTWILDPESMIAKVREMQRAEPNSRQKLRALQSIYHTTFTPGNRLLMLNTGVVDKLSEELRTSASGSKHLMLIVGSLRNLSLNEESKLPMTQKGVHEPLMALSWLGDGELTVKAMGTLMNLTINAAVGLTLLKAGVMRLLIQKLKDSDSEEVQVMAALTLFNLVVNKRTNKSEFRAEAIDALKALLIKRNLLQLTATVTMMLLVGHDRESPFIIFTDKQTNVSQMVTCLRTSLLGRPMYGVRWVPDNLVYALATAALYEPSRKRMAKLGAYQLLTAAVDHLTKAQFVDDFTDDVAIELRSLLKPVLVDMGLLHDAPAWKNQGAKQAGSSKGWRTNKAWATDPTQSSMQTITSAMAAFGAPKKQSSFDAPYAVGSDRHMPRVEYDEEDSDDEEVKHRGVMPF